MSLKTDRIDRLERGSKRIPFKQLGPKIFLQKKKLYMLAGLLFGGACVVRSPKNISFRI